MSKKILIVTEYFYPEEFKINHVALEWKKKGYEVHVLTQQPTYPFGEIFSDYKNAWFFTEDWNGITIYRVKAVTGYKNNVFKKLLKYFSFMILGSILSLKIGKRYDYIFGFDIAALTSMVPSVVLKQFYKKPVTIWIQDIWPDSVYAYGFKKSKFLDFFLTHLVKYVYSNTSSFAISSKGFTEKILPFLNEKKEILYAPNWSDYLNKDLEDFRFTLDAKVHFTFAGNIGKVQNLANVIEGFYNLNPELSLKAQLNIIGDGSYLKELQFIVKSKNIHNIVFHGRKSSDEIYKYLNASDFLIVSLIDKEIFSITVPAKIQTYIACGKPIIGIIAGESKDIILNNKLGFVSSPSNITEITSVFENAINLDVKNQKILTTNCETLTNTVFKREFIIDELLELLIRGKAE